MSLKELLVDGDVLERDETLARLVLRHGVDEEGRIAVVDARQNRGEVQRHPRLYFCDAGTAGSAEAVAAAGAAAGLAGGRRVERLQ